MESKKLYRSEKNKIVGGVAGGFSEYLDVDVTIIRLITILIILSGAGLILYLIAWVLIPIDPSSNDKRSGADEIKDSAERFAQEIKTAIKENKAKNKKDASGWMGWALILIGLFFILQTAVGFDIWSHFWPIIIIILGLVLIIKSLEK